MNSKFSVGVIVGRFQTPELTAGHHNLIDEVLKLHANVVIFIGNSPLLLSKRNPLPYIVREQMVRTAYPMVSIHPIQDLKPAEKGQEDKWNISLDKKIREIVPYGDVTLYGSRDSFLKTYNGKYKTKEIAETACLPATHSRLEVAKVPIDSVDFRKGIIYANFNHFPISYTTVDIAITDGKKWLMGKKYNQDQWRFIGGFSDPDDDTFEISATREVNEETKLCVAPESLQYICSRRIKDWRYEHEEDQIKTLFFKATTTVDEAAFAKGADDIEVVEWHTMDQLKLMVETKQIVTEHLHLFVELQRHLDK